jgi:hypothetical protein
MFSWERTFDCNLLLSKFRKMRRVSDDGKVSWHGFEYRYWRPVLYSAIRCEPEADHLKRRCIDRALNDATHDLTRSDQFLDKCLVAYKALSKTARQPFVLLCDVTYEGPRLVGTIKDGGCSITWRPSPRSKFMRGAMAARAAISDALRRNNVEQNAPGLTQVLVKLEAMDARDAHAQAIDAVDRLRGILNLIVNAGRSLNLFSYNSRQHSINRFRLGPYRTVHKPDGSLAAELFWYEPRWEHQHKSVAFKEDEKEVRKNIGRWRRKARENPLREFVEQGLIRYCRALDQHETEPTLVSLWGVVEYLTNTQQEKYEVTVSRMMRLSSDHADARQIAMHIKQRRNSSVHAGKSPDGDEIDVVLLQAEALAAQLLFFYITNRARLRDQDELTRFLDADLDERRLRRDRRLIDKVIIYRQNEAQRQQS